MISVKYISVVDIPTKVLLTILLFIDCFKMSPIRINTRNHTKEKPYLINSYFFLSIFFKVGKAKKKVNRMSKIYDMYLSEICAERGFVTFLWRLKHVKSSSKIAPFFKFEFRKSKRKFFLM